jgi:hypothetical protein
MIKKREWWFVFFLMVVVGVCSKKVSDKNDTLSHSHTHIHRYNLKTAKNISSLKNK